MTDVAMEVDGEKYETYLVDPLGRELGIGDIRDDGLLLNGRSDTNFSTRYFPFHELATPAWHVYVEDHGRVKDGLAVLRDHS